MKCFLHRNRSCTQECAAYLRLSVAKDELTIVQNGVPLFSDRNGEIRTYCAVIASFWELGEALNRIARAMKPREGEA